MKKLLSILFITVLTFQTTGRLWMKVAFYLNRDYIEENLCINRFDKIPICRGSCFLERKIKEDNDKNQKQLDLKTKDIDLYKTAIQTVIEPPIVHSEISEKYFLLNQVIIAILFSKAVFRPPCQIA